MIIKYLKKIVENYDCLYIEIYYEEFKKDFNSKNDEKLKQLLLNCLSKIQKFNWKYQINILISWEINYILKKIFELL